MLSRFDGTTQLHVRHRTRARARARATRTHIHIPRDRGPFSSASLIAKRACDNGNIAREIYRATFFFTGDLRVRKE